MMRHVPAIPESTRSSITVRLLDHAEKNWPQLAKVRARYHGSFAYITGVLRNGEQIPLFRLRYGGSAHSFGFAIYSAASDRAGRIQSFLGAKYRRLTRRMPKKKALVATGNSMLTIIHALLADPEARYSDLGAGYYEQRMHVRRQARNHVLGLRRLGYQVTIQPVNPDTGELQAATA